MELKLVRGVEKDNFVHVDQWHNKVWLNVQVCGGSARCILNREGAEALIEALKAVLDGEVAAAAK